MSPEKKSETTAVYEEIKPRSKEDCMWQTQNIAYAMTSTLKGSLAMTRGAEPDYFYTKNSAYGDPNAIIASLHAK